MPSRVKTKVRMWIAVCALALVGAGCGGDGGGGATADARVVGTPPEQCVPPMRAERPTIAAPVVANEGSVYTVDLVEWDIANDGTGPVENRERINAALVWALENSYGTVILPAGTYRVGEPTTDNYASGIAIPGSMILELDAGATLEMATNDRWNYCVIEVFGQSDVILRGGTVRGDRDTHVFEGGGAHDEGHTVCVWNESERVLIDSMRLTGGTGDGVLIVGGGGDGTSCKDITIRDNEISDNRRQGVSIVGGVRVLIEGNEIHHIGGTSPQFGVDIESLSYESRDILIRDNHFHENQGGDYVNTDGTNVWFENNVCDQTGLTEIQTDGPIVHWQKTDQTIRGNTITVTVGSSNGRWGIIGYAPHDQVRANPAANYIEDNIFYGGGMHLGWTNLMHVTGNTVNDFLILGYQSTCMLLEDNAINYDGSENYKMREVAGKARGNLLNGEPFDMPMSYDTSFTNSPPHMW